MSYYKLLQAMRDRDEQIPDNDIKYFKSRIEVRKRDIIPSEFYYSQYFLSQFDDPREFSVHYDISEYVNSLDRPPRRKGSSEKIIGRYKSGRNYDQPIFNDDLLTDVKQNNVKVVYSNRK